MSRAVLVTGASSGIGQAVAATMAGVAGPLFIAGRDPGRLMTVARGHGAIPLTVDVTDSAAVHAMASAVAAEAGHLDVLVNCAGQLEVGPAETLGPEVAERLMRVNFLGTVAVIHACLPLLRRGDAPVIVNVASVAGRMAPPYMAAYAASKFAVSGYTAALRQELRPVGIHVALVLPGPVDTPMVSGRLGGPHYPLPPGVPVLTSGRVAQVIRTVIENRISEAIVPSRLALAIRLGSAFPEMVDYLYRAVHRARS